MQYTIPIGSTLDLPLNPAAGQTLSARLLQLVEVHKGRRGPTGVLNADIHADISDSHLEILSSTDSPAAAADGGCLGTGGTVILRVNGLAAGLYRLVVPSLMLEPPERGVAFGGSGWGSTHGSDDMAVHILVLPSTAASATDAEEGTGVMGVDAAAADVENTGVVHEDQATAAAAPTKSAAAPGAADQPAWLWASALPCSDEPAVTQPSPAQQLHITSLTCSAESGLSIRLAGTQQQLGSVQLVAVFSRFLHDSTVSATQLLPQNQVFRFSAMAGYGQGLRFGDAAPQACGDYGRCSYSKVAKLDSAVAYVLQVGCWVLTLGSTARGT